MVIVPFGYCGNGVVFITTFVPIASLSTMELIIPITSELDLTNPEDINDKVA
jgi:hypothetical protein